MFLARSFSKTSLASELFDDVTNKVENGDEIKDHMGAESSEQNDNPAGNKNKGKYTGVK